jgi:hypothetical protein
MIRSRADRCSGPLEIDLAGPQGNAFALLGLATKLAAQLGLDGEAVQTELQAGDYEHLVATFDRHFGAFVVLYR